jgi:hypothetical protein
MALATTRVGSLLGVRSYFLFHSVATDSDTKELLSYVLLINFETTAKNLVSRLHTKGNSIFMNVVAQTLDWRVVPDSPHQSGTVGVSRCRPNSFFHPPKPTHLGKAFMFPASILYPDHICI